MKRNNLYLLLAAGILSACCNNAGNCTVDKEQLKGKWQEVMPVNKQFVQGIELQNEGKASSIGMATLQYEKWETCCGSNGTGQIILSGKSIGNGQTLEFSDTLDIVSLKNDTLTLGKGDMYRIQYVRNPNLQQPIGGSDAAMGYSYSKMLDKKIRIFEEGIQVLSATDPEATLAGYVVFDSDSSRVELFLPEIEGSAVLDRRIRPNGTPVWNVEDDDTFLVEQKDGLWIVSRRAKVLYTSSKEQKQ